jgi:hypothetical protein
VTTWGDETSSLQPFFLITDRAVAAEEKVGLERRLELLVPFPNVSPMSLFVKDMHDEGKKKPSVNGTWLPTKKEKRKRRVSEGARSVNKRSEMLEFLFSFSKFARAHKLNQISRYTDIHFSTVIIQLIFAFSSLRS